MTRGLSTLLDMLERTEQVELECGGLYHAMHGLELYRLRRFGSPERRRQRRPLPLAAADPAPPAPPRRPGRCRRRLASAFRPVRWSRSAAFHSGAFLWAVLPAWAGRLGFGSAGSPDGCGLVRLVARPSVASSAGGSSAGGVGGGTKFTRARDRRRRPASANMFRQDRGLRQSAQPVPLG